MNKNNKDISQKKEKAPKLTGEDGAVRASNIKTPATFTSAPEIKESSFGRFEQNIYTLSRGKIMRHSPGADPTQTNIIRTKRIQNNKGLYVWKENYKVMSISFCTFKKGVTVFS